MDKLTETKDSNHVSTPSMQLSVCFYCSLPPKSNESLKVCANCKIARYHGRICQIRHWKNGHRDMCPQWARKMKLDENLSHLNPISQDTNPANLNQGTSNDASMVFQNHLIVHESNNVTSSEIMNDIITFGQEAQSIDSTLDMKKMENDKFINTTNQDNANLDSTVSSTSLSTKSSKDSRTKLSTDSSTTTLTTTSTLSAVQRLRMEQAERYQKLRENLQSTKETQGTNSINHIMSKPSPPKDSKKKRKDNKKGSLVSDNSVHHLRGSLIQSSREQGNKFQGFFQQNRFKGGTVLKGNGGGSRTMTLRKNGQSLAESSFKPFTISPTTKQSNAGSNTRSSTSNSITSTDSISNTNSITTTAPTSLRAVTRMSSEVLPSTNSNQSKMSQNTQEFLKHLKQKRQYHK